MSERNIETWLASVVHTSEFQDAMLEDIKQLDKPNDRLRARFELLAYLMPKVKGVEPQPTNNDTSEITITYVESKPPKKPKGREASA